MSDARDIPALHELTDGDEGAWERTVDAVYVAMMSEVEAEGSALSPSLRSRLEAEGRRALSVPSRSPAGRLGWAAWSGWATAAVVALAFLILGVPSRSVQGTGALLSAVDGSPDKVSWSLAGLTDEFRGSSGTVVWSNALQKGYMRLRAVPANEPGATQYQLWIVDTARDAQFNRVDGGVFDVASGEVVVPIDAKLSIGSPAAFAITREKPGGVVVSAGPLLMAAKP